MKRTNLLIGAVVSGLVAGSTATLSPAQADHHEGTSVEGKDHACKGGACKGPKGKDAAKMAKEAAKKGKAAAKKVEKEVDPLVPTEETK